MSGGRGGLLDKMDRTILAWEGGGRGGENPSGKGRFSRHAVSETRWEEEEGRSTDLSSVRSERVSCGPPAGGDGPGKRRRVCIFWGPGQTWTAIVG